MKVNVRVEVIVVHTNCTIVSHISFIITTHFRTDSSYIPVICKPCSVKKTWPLGVLLIAAKETLVFSSEMTDQKFRIPNSFRVFP